VARQVSPQSRSGAAIGFDQFPRIDPLSLRGIHGRSKEAIDSGEISESQESGSESGEASEDESAVESAFDESGGEELEESESAPESKSEDDDEETMADVIERSKEMLKKRGVLSTRKKIAILEGFRAVIKAQYGEEKRFVPGFSIHKSGKLTKGATILHYRTALDRIDKRLSKLREG